MILVSLPRLTRPCWEMQSFCKTPRVFKTKTVLASAAWTEFYYFLTLIKQQHLMSFQDDRCLCKKGELKDICFWQTFEHDEKEMSTFAVSTLASREQLLQCGTLYIPPWSCWTQKAIRPSVGHQLKSVRWAESGGRCHERFIVNVTFLWMSELH